MTNTEELEALAERLAAFTMQPAEEVKAHDVDYSGRAFFVRADDLADLLDKAGG